MQPAEQTIWMQDRHDGYSTPVGFASVPYLTPKQNSRLARITQARRLYEGDHYAFFVKEKRTLWTPPKINVYGTDIEVYSELNLLKLISNKSADLLFGAEPTIKVDGDEQERYLKQLVDRSQLPALLIESEIDCSMAGESVLEACVYEGEVFLKSIPPEHIHPIGELLPSRQYAGYVYYAEHNAGTEQNPAWLLLEVKYQAGRIDRAVYNLSPERKKLDRVALDRWPDFATVTPQESEATGIPMNTIIWIPNLIMAGRAMSDYDGLIKLQDKLNFKNSQLDAVIAKHAAPKVAINKNFANANGTLNLSRMEAFYVNHKDEIPQYVIWDANVVAAQEERNKAVSHLCMTAEMSEMLLGIDKGGMPESARKFRLNATNSLAKAARKAQLRRPLIKRALTVAQMLEQTLVGVRYDIGEISVEMRDGLPIDPLEEAQEVALWRGSRSMSRRAAVERRLNNPAAVDAEMAELAREDSAAVGSTLGMLTSEPNQRETAPEPASSEAA